MHHNEMVDVLEELFVLLKNQLETGEDITDILSSYSIGALKNLCERTLERGEFILFEHIIRSASFELQRHSILNTLLYRSLLTQNLSKVQYLLERGYGDINMRDDEGRSLLHIAVMNDNAVILQLLCQHNDIHINRCDNQERTALIAAAKFGHKHCVEVLLKNRGLDIFHKDTLGQSALTSAAYAQHTAVVQALLVQQGLIMGFEITNEDCQTLCLTFVGLESLIERLSQEWDCQREFLTVHKVLLTVNSKLIFPLGSVFESGVKNMFYKTICLIEPILCRLELEVSALMSLQQAVLYHPPETQPDQIVTRSKRKALGNY